MLHAQGGQRQFPFAGQRTERELYRIVIPRPDGLLGAVQVVIGKADEADLAGLLQLQQCLVGFIPRTGHHMGIVELIDVDVVGAQAFQACLYIRQDV